MNSRKLLAFILVFSLATQPGGVRFSYAEDTKAAEVKIEEKTEASDELAISGALAGVIAAGVAAVTAAVGTAGLMIYNGVSNKDEIAKLWTSEEDSFFSRLGKTISILFKGANKVPGEQGVVEENTETPAEEQELETAKKNGQEKLTNAINAADGKGGNALNEAKKLQTELTNAINAPDATADSINTVANQVDGVVSELNKAVEEAKVKEHNTKIRLNFQEQRTRFKKLVQDKMKLKRQVDSVQLQINALKEEDRGEVQEELNKIKNVIEKATSVEGLEGQLSSLRMKVEDVDSKAKEEAERLEKEEAERKAKEEPEVKKQETDEIGQDEKPVDNAENNDAQQDTNEGSNSHEKNPTTISVEEKKEPFTHTFTAAPYYRYEKKRVQKKIDEIKNTCGLNTTNLQRQLNGINLEDVETIEELRTAEESITKVGKEITSLLNGCKTIKFSKGYIEDNIQAVVDILDKSDVSLDHDWDELKNKPVTEGNVGELTEEYTTIAGRVRAIIDNNKERLKLTGKISKVIEDNKNAAWFDEAYYNEKLNNLSNKVKTEEGLKEIVNELEELVKVSEVNKWLDKIERGEIAEGICEHTWKLLFGKTLSYAGCTVLHGKVDEEVKHLKAKFKEDHDADAFIKALKELHNNSQSYINDATYLEFDANAAEEEIKKLEKIGIDVAAAREKLDKLKEYSLDNLPTKRADVKKFLTDMVALDKALNKIKSSEFAKYFAQGKCLVGDKCGIHDRYADILESLVENDFKDAEEVLNNINETEKTSAKINSKIKQLSAYSWFDKKHYEKRLNEIEVAPKNMEDLRVLTDRRAGLLSNLEDNFSKKEIMAVNKALDEIDNSELVKYFESEECSASDKEDRYEPYEELVKPLIAKKNEIIAEAKKNHSLNGVEDKLKELLSIKRKVLNTEADKRAVEGIIALNKDAKWFDKAYFEEWLQGATKDKIATEADLELRANNVAAILNDLETNYVKHAKAVNNYLSKIDNNAIVKGNCTQSSYLGLKKENKLTSEQCNTLKDKFVAERDLLIEEAKSNHSVVGLAEKLKNLYGKTDEYINDVAKLNADADKIEEIINEAGKFGLIDTEYFNNKLEENKDYSLENLQIKGTAMKAFLDELQKNYSKKEIEAVNQKINSLKNSDLLKGDLGDDYADLRSSVESSMGQVIAAAKKNHSLNGMKAELEKLLSHEKSIARKVLNIEGNTKEVKAVVKQYENEAWFDKAYFKEWLQGATKDKIATEADLDLRANNVAAILNDLETNFSKKEIEAVNKALDEFDNSAIVKGTCTQSSWGGLKKENKLTPEQCNTLKDKFVAERDHLVEEAKSSHSAVGLAQKLKNLYGKTDKYINDVADLNADADKIEEIINEAGKFGLIEPKDFNNKLKENKDYSLDDLKIKREAMTELLNSLSTYTSENITEIKAALDSINGILSKKDFKRLKVLSKNFNSEVDAKIANIKSTAKQKCSLDGVIDDLNDVLDLCEYTVSISVDFIERFSVVGKLLKEAEDRNLKVRSDLKTRYEAIKRNAPTNIKELHYRFVEINELLNDLNESGHWKIINKVNQNRYLKAF